MRWLLLLAILGMALPSHAQLVFSDASFLDVDWSSTVMTLNHPGAGGSSAHASTGGNPGDHRMLTTQSCSGNIPCRVMMIEMKAGAVFDPSTQGPIVAIDYREDQLCASADGCVGGGQAWLPACSQDGKFYIHSPGTSSGVLNSWTTRSLTGLVASDFGEVVLSADGMHDLGSNPNFSGTGTAIQFGYARANSLSSGRTGRIDNWSVTVFYTPVATEESRWGAVKSLYR